jgi:teichuronic acid biosynthesis glycosyltransferase TuaC
MRILIVCKANFESSEMNFQKNRAYVYDQFVGIKKHFHTVDVFFLRGTGILSYIKGAFELRKFLKNKKYDILHAHYGYCGFIAGLVSRIPVVVTYHGTDINEKVSNVISSFSIFMASWNIFVSEKLYKKALFRSKKNFSIIPCGVDLNIFKPIDLELKAMNENNSGRKKEVLFSSSFSNKVKNFSLANDSLLLVKNYDVTLIELVNKTRKEVSEMLNKCDALLLTSFTEGSPQIIKEAMACNCPIVSTDVGDVKNIIWQTNNCFVAAFDKEEIAEKMKIIFDSGKRSNGRGFIEVYDNERVVGMVVDVYHKVFRNS